MSAILRLSGVSKRFGALLAVDNLSMHLNDGEALGVIGPNGSGKTTVFNVLSGITKADQGEVFFQGTDITHLRAFERCHRGIARSFQIPRPFAGMSVFENLLVGAAFGDGKPGRSAYNQCVQVLEETGSLHPADIEQKTIEQDGLAVSLTIVRPIDLKERGPAFLFFHGGGFVLGDFVTHERLVRDLVSDSEITAIFVNYTRSPEARYPTAINEAYAATKWVAANGDEINVDGKRLALVGNSAGATIAAVTAVKCKLEGGPALKGQLLFCPMTDANFETSSYNEYAEGYLITKNTMKWFWDNHVPDLAQRREVYPSPLQAGIEQLKGLPPAHIQIAGNDVLRDEGVAYARKLDAAEVEVTLVRYDSMIHDYCFFNHLSRVPAVRSALHQAAEELKRYLEE